MKSSIIKEIYWLGGLLLLAGICVFVRDKLMVDDINAHDTYYYGGRPSISTTIFWAWVKLVFVVFSIRAIITRFHNNYTLYILAACCILIIFSLQRTNIDLSAFEFPPDKTEGPITSIPQSTDSPPVTGLFYGESPMVSLVITGGQALLMIFMVFVGIRIGRNRYN